MIARYWNTFETLAEIARETAKNDNSAWEIAIHDESGVLGVTLVEPLGSQRKLTYVHQKHV